MSSKQRLGFFVVVVLFSPWINVIRKIDFTHQSNGFWQNGEPCLPKDLNENSGILQARYSVTVHLARGALASLMSQYIIKTLEEVDF